MSCKKGKSEANRTGAWAPPGVDQCTCQRSTKLSRHQVHMSGILYHVFYDFSCNYNITLDIWNVFLCHISPQVSLEFITHRSRKLNEVTSWKVFYVCVWMSADLEIKCRKCDVAHSTEYSVTPCKCLLPVLFTDVIHSLSSGQLSFTSSSFSKSRKSVQTRSPFPNIKSKSSVIFVPGSETFFSVMYSSMVIKLLDWTCCKMYSSTRNHLISFTLLRVMISIFSWKEICRCKSTNKCAKEKNLIKKLPSA